jgi:hypothetical protein
MQRAGQDLVNNVQNRPVDDNHVEALVHSFSKIRRCQPQDQLDVAMTADDFEHCLKYTIAQMTAKKADMPYYQSVEDLRKAVDPSIFYMKYESMPVLCWDTNQCP